MKSSYLNISLPDIIGSDFKEYNSRDYNNPLTPQLKGVILVNLSRPPAKPVSLYELKKEGDWIIKYNQGEEVIRSATFTLFVAGIWNAFGNDMEEIVRKCATPSCLYITYAILKYLIPQKIVEEIANRCRKRKYKSLLKNETIRKYVEQFVFAILTGCRKEYGKRMDKFVEKWLKKSLGEIISEAYGNSITFEKYKTYIKHLRDLFNKIYGILEKAPPIFEEPHPSLSVEIFYRKGELPLPNKDRWYLYILLSMYALATGCHSDRTVIHNKGKGIEVFKNISQYLPKTWKKLQDAVGKELTIEIENKYIGRKATIRFKIKDINPNIEAKYVRIEVH